jgi:predicted nucleic acid-binding OB-fold protein
MERKNYRKNYQQHGKSTQRKPEYRRSEFLRPGMAFYILGITQGDKSVDITDNDRGFIRLIPKVANALMVPELKLVQLYLNSNTGIQPEDYIVYRANSDIIKLKRFIGYDQLSANEQLILSSVVQKYIESSPDSFIHSINNAPPLSLTKHSLELLPNVGKKTMQTIVKEIGSRKFDSLEDMKKRSGVGVNVITERVIDEIKSDDEKYYMFLKWKGMRDSPPENKPYNDSRAPQKRSKRTAPYKNIGGFQNHR